LGKKIKVTENHKFLVDNNLIKASDLKKGDCLRITKELKIGHKRFIRDPIISIIPLGEKESYCLNVDAKNHLVVANNIITKNCDGDELAVMLLLDMLINFSRKYLPAHRGGTQDAPLVLNARIRAGEVDDMIFDVDTMKSYPLELYKLAEKFGHHYEVKIDQIKNRLGKEEFTNQLKNLESESKKAIEEDNETLLLRVNEQ